jgi:hypothetical protein
MCHCNDGHRPPTPDAGPNPLLMAVIVLTALFLAIFGGSDLLFGTKFLSGWIP